MDPQQALLTLQSLLPALQNDTRRLIEIAQDQAKRTGQPVVRTLHEQPALPALRESVLRRLKLLVNAVNSAEQKNAHAIKRGAHNFIPGRQPVPHFERQLAPLKARLQQIAHSLSVAIGQIDPPGIRGQHGVTIKSWEKTLEHYTKLFTEQPDRPEANYDLVFRQYDGPQAGFDPTVLVALAYGVINLLLTRLQNRSR